MFLYVTDSTLNPIAAVHKMPNASLEATLKTISRLVQRTSLLGMVETTSPTCNLSTVAGSSSLAKAAALKRAKHWLAAHIGSSFCQHCRAQAPKFEPLSRQIEPQAWTSIAPCCSIFSCYTSILSKRRLLEATATRTLIGLRSPGPSALS